MRQEYRFEIGEITISKQSADHIRNEILTIARSRDIGTDPIQFERLLNDIKNRMIDLSESIDFYFDGNQVDFKDDNFVMFKSKVLKSFLSIKKDNDTIALQKKNLDILSFYAFGKSWSETIKPANSIENEVPFGQNESKLRIVSKNRLTKLVLAILPYILLIFLFVQYINLREVNKRSLTEQLIKFKDRESKYQAQLIISRDQYYKLNGYEFAYYDTLNIPDSAIIIFMKNFDTDTVSTFIGGASFEIIRSSIKYLNEPGIKQCSKFNGKRAFGFGKSFCTGYCYELVDQTPYQKQPFHTIFRINFKDSAYVSYLTFKWVEVDGNWGSGGYVYINGKEMGSAPYHYIGITPASNLLVDETVRNFKLKVAETTKFIEIFVYDIANESEILINDIHVYGKIY